MKAMILAAGQGTRVRPLTKSIPKPMIPILGKPVMEYLIEHLASFGIREIMVNVSHHHERIENYFGIVGSRQGRLRTPWPPSGHLWLGVESSLHFDHHFNALFLQFRKLRFEPSALAPIEMLRA